MSMCLWYDNPKKCSPNLDLVKTGLRDGTGIMTLHTYIPFVLSAAQAETSCVTKLNNIQKPIVRKNYSDSLSSFKTWSHIVVASYESQISYHQQPTILPRIIHHSECCVSEVNIEQEALFASFVFGHFLGEKWHWIPLLRLVEEVYYEGLVPLEEQTSQTDNTKHCLRFWLLSKNKGVGVDEGNLKVGMCCWWKM